MMQQKTVYFILYFIYYIKSIFNTNTKLLVFEVKESNLVIPFTTLAEYNAMLWWIPVLKSCLCMLGFYPAQGRGSTDAGMLQSLCFHQSLLHAPECKVRNK